MPSPAIDPLDVVLYADDLHVEMIVKFMLNHSTHPKGVLSADVSDIQSLRLVAVKRGMFPFQFLSALNLFAVNRTDPGGIECKYHEEAAPFLRILAPDDQCGFLPRLDERLQWPVSDDLIRPVVV